MKEAHCEGYRRLIVEQILKGSLKETLYSWPDRMVNDGKASPLKIKKETIYQNDQVTYVCDKVGVHLHLRTLILPLMPMVADWSS